MNANEIFQNMIGSELEGLVVKYTPYNENFDVHPYRQSITTDFEKQFADLLFDSIIFYAFEKEEIFLLLRLEKLKKDLSMVIHWKNKESFSTHDFFNSLCFLMDMSEK